MTTQIWSIIGLAAASVLVLCFIYRVTSQIRRELAEIKQLLETLLQKKPRND
jgi:hypothetical protein